jgi:hypothetical protein
LNLDNNFQKKITSLYSTYNNQVKPLFALIESTFQALPVSIVNEIRAFNDHIARCYVDDVKNDFKTKQLDKAENHIERMLLDSFKFLCFFYEEEVRDFKRTYKKYDLTSINNGKFLMQLKTVIHNCHNTYKDAKIIEPLDKELSFKNYQQTFKYFEEFIELTNKNIGNLINLKRKHTFFSLLKLFIFIIGAIISGIIGSIITSGIPQQVKAFFTFFF